MKKILSSLSTWKLVTYLLLTLLYSLQGLLLSFIIQFSSSLDGKSFEKVTCFGLLVIGAFLMIYLFMYLENVLLRSMIKDFNLMISKKAVQSFYLDKIDFTDSQLNSFLTQDLPLFWQEYLVPLLSILVFALSISTTMTYLLIQNFFLGLLFSLGSSLMIIPQFLCHRLLQKRGEEFANSREKCLAAIVDFSKGIETIRSNQALGMCTNYVQKYFKINEEKQMDYYTSHNLVMFLSGPLKGLGLILPFLIGISNMGSMKLSLTSLIAMMTASMNLIGPLQQILELTSSIQSSQMVRDKILSVLDIELEVKNITIEKEENAAL